MGSVIRGVRPSEFGIIAQIHVEAFPDDFLSQLGRDVVGKAFGEKVNSRPEATMLVALDEVGHRPVGYCFGGKPPANASRPSPELLAAVALSFFRRPGRVIDPKLQRSVRSRLRFHTKRLLERLHSRFSTEAKSSDMTGLETLNVYEIFSLAVSAEARNRGVGKSLMAQHERQARAQECDAISLDAPRERPATIAFYERIGFYKVPSRRGAWEGHMLKSLRTPVGLTPPVSVDALPQLPLDPGLAKRNG